MFMPGRAVHIIILLSIILGAAAYSPLSGQDAPVVSGGNITSAVAGTSCTLPVAVDNFNNISQFTLTLKFDTTRVRFLTSSGIALPGTTVTYTPPSGNTQGKIIIAWNGGANYNLPNGTALVHLTFSYTQGTGLLTWAYTYGSVCQFKRLVSGTPTVLNDNPKYHFYRNGGISNRGAPDIYAPILPVTTPGPVALAVTTDSFTSISAMTLYMEYDTAAITFLNFTKNPAFGSTFQVGNIAGSGGKMNIAIQWFGNPLTLANGSTIITLHFNYTGSEAGTELKWFDNIPSCEFTDATDVLIDLPQTDYFHDGFAGPPLIADFTADTLTPPRNSVVTFTDLSTGTPATSWLWTFDPPGALFVNGTGSLSQPPQVIFPDGGLYTVALTVQNGYFSDSEIKTGYIRAGTAGLWTGESSANWDTANNWDNRLIPDAGTLVVIPPAAPNWPVFEGDLTIGLQCAGLTLSGTTSYMTVNGDLILTAP
jgi:PKD repeat protein